MSKKVAETLRYFAKNNRDTAAQHQARVTQAASDIARYSSARDASIAEAEEYESAAQFLETPK